MQVGRRKGVAWNLKSSRVGGGDGGSNPESAPDTGDVTEHPESHRQSMFKSVLYMSSAPPPGSFEQSSVRSIALRSPQPSDGVQ